uniref:Uncharacterized protein n=1 Tax=Manihot esculenta TaxID=3983 RepID=A0A2C9USZ5_MANES
MKTKIALFNSWRKANANNDCLKVASFSEDASNVLQISGKVKTKSQLPAGEENTQNQRTQILQIHQHPFLI